MEACNLVTSLSKMCRICLLKQKLEIELLDGYYFPTSAGGPPPITCGSRQQAGGPGLAGLILYPIKTFLITAWFQKFPLKSLEHNTLLASLRGIVSIFLDRWMGEQRGVKLNKLGS